MTLSKKEIDHTISLLCSLQKALEIQENKTSYYKDTARGFAGVCRLMYEVMGLSDPQSQKLCTAKILSFPREKEEHV